MKLNSGFTLIELLVVIAIIGLLATLSVVAFTTSASKGRDAVRKTDLRAMQKALELYYSDNGSYPSSGGAWRSTCASWGSYPRSGPTGYIPNLAPMYMGILPVDPKPMPHPELSAGCVGTNACYIYRSDGSNYKILSYCNMENGAAPPGDAFYDPLRGTYSLSLCGGSDPLGTCNAW